MDGRATWSIYNRRMRSNAATVIFAVVSLIALIAPSASHAEEVDNAVRSMPTRQQETEDLMTEVDAWLKAEGLNGFGDPKDTMYTGGSPLFDESTGERRDRYAYIRSRHPDEPWKRGSVRPKIVDVDETRDPRFPARWGPEPPVQTRDYRELPGGYGFGSSTLYKWIETNMAKDAEDSDETEETLGAAPGPAPNTSQSTEDEPEDDL